MMCKSICNNKKGQTLGLAVIIGITVFIVGIMTVNFIMPEVTRTRNSDNLNCADTSISDGTRLTCLVVDVVVPYFIVAVVSVAVGVVTARWKL